jgi:thioesterase domain-containing protein/aryl carrier-like protein
MSRQTPESELSPKAQRLFELLGGQNLAPEPEPRTTAPLSYTQERFWLIEKLSQDLPANVSTSLKIEGPLSVKNLQASLDLLVENHAIFRTRYLTDSEGQLTQQVMPAASLEMHFVDLTQIDPAKSLDQATAGLEAAAKQPFDLGAAPMLRAQLYQLSAEKWVFGIQTHYLVADGWSLGLLLNEITAGYTGSPRPGPETTRYIEFSEWQRSQAQTQYWVQDSQHWQERLRGAPAQLRLPTQYERPAVQMYTGLKSWFELTPSLTDSLKRLSQENSVTLYTTLISAYGLLLAGYAQQSDLIIGGLVSQRSKSEFETLIGTFVNILPLRIDLHAESDHEINFKDLLLRSRLMLSSSLAHQSLPTEQLIKSLNINWDPAYSPLLQATFVLHQEDQAEQLALPDVRVSLLPKHIEPTQFDLRLVMNAGERTLSGGFCANAGIFGREALDAFDADFIFLLEQIAQDPERSLTGLIARLSNNPAWMKYRPTAEDPELIGEARKTPAAALNAGYMPPTNPVEAELAQLLSQALDVERVGSTDNFFDLGGGSLVAIRVLEAIKHKLGTELSFTTFTEHPTIRQLALHILNDPESQPEQALVVLQPEGQNPPFYFIHGQGGHLMRGYHLAHHFFPTHPFYGLRSLGWRDDSRILQDFQAMATAYIQEIQVIQPQGPYYFGGYSLGGLLALEMAQQFQALGETVGVLIAIDTNLTARRAYIRRLTIRERIIRKVVATWFSIWDDIRRSLAGEEKEQDIDLDEIPESELKRTERIRKANRKASIRYRLENYAGDLVLIRLADRKYRPYGWDKVIDGEIRTHLIDCTHEELVQAPYAGQVAQVIKDYIG